MRNDIRFCKDKSIVSTEIIEKQTKIKVDPTTGIGEGGIDLNNGDTLYIRSVTRTANAPNNPHNIYFELESGEPVIAFVYDVDEYNANGEYLINALGESYYYFEDMVYVPNILLSVNLNVDWYDAAPYVQMTDEEIWASEEEFYERYTWEGDSLESVLLMFSEKTMTWTIVADYSTINNIPKNMKFTSDFSISANEFIETNDNMIKISPDGVVSANEFLEELPVSTVLPKVTPVIDYNSTDGIIITNADEINKQLAPANLTIQDLDAYIVVKHPEHDRFPRTSRDEPTKPRRLFRFTRNYNTSGVVCSDWLSISGLTSIVNPRINENNILIFDTYNTQNEVLNRLDEVTLTYSDSSYKFYDDYIDDYYEYLCVGISFGYKDPISLKKVFSHMSSNSVMCGGAYAGMRDSYYF